ncbi:MAG: cupin domain-containing protein [Aggregatilineales bacterium]
MSKTHDRTKLLVIHPDEGVQDTHHGFMRQWGITQETTGAQSISMTHGTLAPGLRAEPHYHPFETAIYVISGIAKVYYGPNLEHEVICQAGDFVYIAPGVVHAPENIGDVPLDYVAARSAPADIYYLPGTGPMA